MYNEILKRFKKDETFEEETKMVWFDKAVKMIFDVGSLYWAWLIVFSMHVFITI